MVHATRRSSVQHYMSIICLSFMLCAVLYFEGQPTFFVAARTPPPRNSNNQPASVEPLKLDEARLPPLQQVLEELNLSSKLRDFVRMGVTDTRLLLRLKRMDFNIMEMEWVDDSAPEGSGSVTSADIANLKKKVADMITEYALKVDVDKLREDRAKLLQERKQLKYGRMYVDNNVQSFDYAVATFGAPAPPVGPKRLFIVTDPNPFGCNTTAYSPQTAAVTDPDTIAASTDAYVVVHRGMCPFLAKATYMKRRYPTAAGLLIVNTDEVVEAPSSGYGVDPTVTDRDVETFHKMHRGTREDYSVVSIARSSWARVEKSMANNAVYYTNTTANAAPELKVSLIPLQCGGAGAATGTSGKGKKGGKAAIAAPSAPSGPVGAASGAGTCRPLMPEEHDFAHEATCGNVQFLQSNGQESPVFDFLAANVGATLPDSDHPAKEVKVNDVFVTVAEPQDGCTPLTLPPTVTSTTSVTTTVTTKVTTEGDADSSSTTTTSVVPTPAADYYRDTAVFMTRGGCSFEQKLHSAQDANALYVIIADNHDDNALQHIGISRSPAPAAAVAKKTHEGVVESPKDIVTVPSVLITKAAGDWVLDHFKPVAVGKRSEGLRSVLHLHKNNVQHHAPSNATSDSVAVKSKATYKGAAGAVTARPTIAHHWIDLAHYPWVTVDASTKAAAPAVRTKKKDGQDKAEAAPLTLQQQLEAYVMQVEVLMGKYLHLSESMAASAKEKDNGKGAKLAKHYYGNIISWLRMRKDKALRQLAEKSNDEL